MNDTTQNIDENNLTEINNTNNSTENNKNIDIRGIIFNENVSLNASSGIIVPINSAEASGAAGTAINDAGQKYVKLLDDLGFFEYLDEHPDACAIYFADMCSGYSGADHASGHTWVWNVLHIVWDWIKYDKHNILMKLMSKHLK